MARNIYSLSGRYLCNSLENQQIYFMDTSAYRRLTCEECCYLPFRTNSSIILLASSILFAFNDERYILVVFSESCPNPSLMTEMGILLL